VEPPSESSTGGSFSTLIVHDVVVVPGHGPRIGRHEIEHPGLRIQRADKGGAIQALAGPVPVPSSRNAPFGFEATRVRSSSPVHPSDAMVKPIAAVSCAIAASADGRLGLWKPRIACLTPLSVCSVTRACMPRSAAVLHQS
jgi:hypothetical protein